MAEPILPDDTPEHDDTGDSTRKEDGGANSGGTPPPPRDPTDPLSEPHLKSLAEHITRFLAGSHSSGGSEPATVGK